MLPDKFPDNFDSIAELRVSGGTPPKDLAASIIHALNDGKRVRLSAIGHQAVGQAIKSIPVVNQYCVAQGYVISVLPSFTLMPVVNRELGNGDTADPTADRAMVDRTVTVLSLIRISPQ